MKQFIVICAALMVAYAQEKYTDKYDNIDVEEIMSNKRLFMPYVECIMDRGQCTNEAAELKAHLQEAIETGCVKCNQKQEDLTAKVIKKLVTDYLTIWNELVAKYDPTGKWRKEYAERAKKYGFEIPA